jgi:hypothetical protein
MLALSLGIDKASIMSWLRVQPEAVLLHLDLWMISSLMALLSSVWRRSGGALSLVDTLGDWATVGVELEVVGADGLSLGGSSILWW